MIEQGGDAQSKEVLSIQTSEKVMLNDAAPADCGFELSIVSDTWQGNSMHSLEIMGMAVPDMLLVFFCWNSDAQCVLHEGSLGDDTACKYACRKWNIMLYLVHLKVQLESSVLCSPLPLGSLSKTFKDKLFKFRCKIGWSSSLSSSAPGEGGSTSRLL